MSPCCYSEPTEPSDRGCGGSHPGGADSDQYSNPYPFNNRQRKSSCRQGSGRTASQQAKRQSAPNLIPCTGMLAFAPVVDTTLLTTGRTPETRPRQLRCSGFVGR